MYYCQPCAQKAGIITHWQTYAACDCCGDYGIVYDHCAKYGLPSTAPLVRDTSPLKREIKRTLRVTKRKQPDYEPVQEAA